MLIDHELRYLAVMICLYSLSEFLIKRLLWRSVPAIPLLTMFLQSGILLIILVVGTLGFSSLELLLGYIAVTILRTFFEFFLRACKQRSFLEAFVFTQATTILLLVAVWRFVLPVHVHDWYASFETSILESLGGVGMYLQQNATTIFVTLTAYSVMVDGGAKLVRGVLNKFPKLMGKVAIFSGDSNENIGEWIGVLERVITLTFVLTGSYTAVAFALTAKSIARFKELEDKNFAEYYLLGTSSSVATALLVGALVQVLIKNL
jgi:uncharacterized membrane protein (DUF485 family)